MTALDGSLSVDGGQEPSSVTRASSPCLMGTETVRNLRHRFRNVEKSLAKVAPARMFAAIPRTGGFAYRTLLRRHSGDRSAGLPDTRLTPSLLAHVAMDEAIITAAVGPNRLPTRSDFERVSGELRDARALYDEHGWIQDPGSYHRVPPALDRVQTKPGWANGLSYELVLFTSEYEPHENEPGRERWLDFHTNRTASAWMLRHPDSDSTQRPWLVCIHGFGTGQAYMDFPAFHVSHLHHDLGLNLLGPVLPLHGHRRVGRFGGDQFLSVDLINSVHGLSQAVWDIRRLLGFVRAHEPGGQHVSVYGVSLGAYVAALLACFDADLDAVIAGIPVSDFPALYGSQSPPVIKARSIEAGILGGPAEMVHRVVSPLALPPLVPSQRRFIFAGEADRMSHPRQAHNLWRHWDEPRILWYPGNHVGYLWSGAVKHFVDEALVASGADARARGRESVEIA